MELGGRLQPSNFEISLVAGCACRVWIYYWNMVSSGDRWADVAHVVEIHLKTIRLIAYGYEVSQMDLCATKWT
jgi:hypothetical protein